MTEPGPLDRVRRLCLALPDTSERLSHGAPAFFVREKHPFVRYHDDHHGDGRLALWCKAPPGLQESLIGEDAERFFRPPYAGPYGWVGVRLDRDPDWERVADLIALAHSLARPAPRRR